MCTYTALECASLGKQNIDLVATNTRAPVPRRPVNIHAIATQTHGLLQERRPLLDYDYHLARQSAKLSALP